MRFDRLGWLVASALVGAMMASGFQGNAPKFGTVDIKKVFDKSEYAVKQTEVLRTLGKSREGILQFINQYRVMKVEDAQRFRDLSLKPNQTAADRDAIEKLKASVVTEDAAFKALLTKQSPSADEQKQLATYNQRVQQLGALQANWAREFDEEVSNLQTKLRDDTLSRVKESVGQVAKAQGYSIVFLSDVAPYSSNDITDEALKIMNAKK